MKTEIRSTKSEAKPNAEIPISDFELVASFGFPISDFAATE
jgi:hypothetical protein